MLTPEQTHLLGWFREHAASQRAAGFPGRALRVVTGALGLARRHLSRDASAEERLILFSLLADAGRLLLECGHAHQAEPDLRLALDLAADETLAVPPAAWADLRQYLGAALDAQGREEEAAEQFVLALDLLETLDPPPLASIAGVANNLGMIRRGQGRFEEAAALYRRAQEIYEAMGPPHALDLATICNNQGSLFWAWSQPDLARDFHLVALKLRRDALPRTHPDIAQSASNLAAVYYDTGDFDRAGRNYLRALEILAHHLPEQQETYEIVAQNYADLLEQSGRAGRADRLRHRTRQKLLKARERAADRL